MQMKYISLSPSQPSGLLQKTVAIVTSVALAGVALMFSAVLLVVIAVAVVLGAIYLWWKTREIRKQLQQMRDFAARGAPMQGEEFKGEIIEGEVIRVDEPKGGSTR